MESPQENLGVDSKRQMRRRKLLENAKSRMDKLKNTQRSLSLVKEYEDDSSLDAGSSEAAPDPPDELIPNLKRTAVSPEALSSTPVQSKNSGLVCAVNRFSADGVWKLRTLLALLCAIAMALVERTFGLVYSSVLLMAILDVTLLVCVVFAPGATKSDTAGNPLGAVALVKVVLTLLHSSSAHWFEPLCLSLLLVAHLLRDILIMIFFAILLNSCIVISGYS